MSARNPNAPTDEACLDYSPERFTAGQHQARLDVRAGCARNEATVNYHLEKDRDRERVQLVAYWLGYRSVITEGQ